MPWRSFSDRQNVVWTHFRDVPVGVSRFFSKEEIRAYIKRLSASGMTALSYR